MSVSFASTARISMDDVFDGRLKPYGIRERRMRERHFRCLTDGKDELVVSEDRYGAFFTVFFGHAPIKILIAIQDCFCLKLYSEHDHQFWGFKSKRDWKRHPEVWWDVEDLEGGESRFVRTRWKEPVRLI